MPVLETEFNRQIHQHTQPQGKIVLALSGGLDSRVLLELLARFKRDNPNCDVKAVYVHHGLSANADQWENNCKEWCAQSQVPFSCERVSLDTQSSESLEELARDARYQVLEKHIDEGDVLLTGQHLSDQSETFLLALKRGSGPKGLASMAQSAPFGRGTLLRPLFNVPRHSIERFALDNKLEWNHDESNDDTQFDRNFLRHKVIPQLTERWPGFEKAVHRSATLCAEQQLLLEELLESKLNEATTKDAGMSIPYLAEQSHLARAQLIRMWLERQNAKMPSRKQLQLVWDEVACSQRDANPNLKLSSGEVRRHDDKLYLVSPQRDLSDWSNILDVNQSLILPDGLGHLTLKNTDLNPQGLLLRAPLQREKVTVHFCPQGLSAKPVGRNGSRKLKKLFQEYGVPSWKRRQMPIVMYNDHIAAVADLFVTQRFCAPDCELIWVH
ncbi:tRNA lysidine(34) synthetase TilS [Vibrio nigripulchritudo]|uniref:tRNA lysidine(34) synthetase TilS n=1 Tax=Vibrio nigripulchritudo TaxID=28173 RepID=UPI0013C31520|nr:tRNA lysidine(34) synthetase TilS [Vibrio nigripulchritudo]